MSTLESDLYYAIEAENAASVRLALEAGADPNTVFWGANYILGSHWSALHICCQKGLYDCTKCLLEAGTHAELKVCREVVYFCFELLGVCFLDKSFSIRTELSMSQFGFRLHCLSWYSLYSGLKRNQNVAVVVFLIVIFVFVLCVC